MDIFVKCVLCGKEYVRKRKGQKYCSLTCQHEAKKKSSKEWYRKNKPQKKEAPGTLCWRCKNAAGFCSWSDKSFTPVDGWTAIPTKIKNGRNDYMDSFEVIECPLFEEG